VAAVKFRAVLSLSALLVDTDVPVVRAVCWVAGYLLAQWACRHSLAYWAAVWLGTEKWS